MRSILVLSLLSVAAAAQGRSAAELLDDHLAALGDPRGIEALSAKSKGVETHWRLPATCVRVLPPRGKFPWREYFRPGAAFIEQGLFERWRANQQTTRGGYYFFKALAEPFPLLPYAKDAAARGALKAGAAEMNEVRYDVLATPRDVHDVRALYFLHPKTHLIDHARFESEKDRPFVTVTFARYVDVGGVKLPRDYYARFRMLIEDSTTRKLESRWVSREERGRSWKRKDAPAGVRFEPPGLLRRSDPKDGCFEKRTFATGPDPHELGIGDLDGDGRADVAVACEGGVWVHFGGAEAKPVAVELGAGHFRGLVIDDLDADGRLEVVTTSNLSPPQNFHVISFDEERRRSTRTIYGAPVFTHSLVSDDLDLDGIPDLVATGHVSRDLQIKFGNGAGRFRLLGSPWPLDSRDVGRRGFGVAVGNVDADGMRDIAVADGTRIVIFRGRPNLSFQPQLAVPPDDRPGWRPVAVALADLDGDGYDDVLATREHPVEDLTGDLVVIRNRRKEDGGRKLEVTRPIDVGARVQSVATGHFDGDWKLDVVATSFLDGSIGVFFNDGEGGFDRRRMLRYRSGRGAARVVVGDHDGDGRDDAVVANRLGDSITVFRGTKGPSAPLKAPTRAVECDGPVEADFTLPGLSHRFAFEGEFRIPARIRDPSGLACLGGVASSQFVFVSDKRPALFRATLDRARKRFLVGPAIPLRGMERTTPDLEAVAYDTWSSTLFLACESDGTVARATIFGDVLGRVPAGVSGGNDGIEGLAFRRKLDGTPLLYVFRERIGTTMRQPPFHVFEPTDEGGFGLEPRLKDQALPLYVADQSGATVAFKKLLVVSRLARGIVEVGFDGDGLAKKGHVFALYGKLTDELLGLKSAKLARFGNVEGIAVDPRGDLFLLVDNNRETIGVEGKNRGPEGRLLWFRNLDPRPVRAQPARVKLKHIHIPFEGARGAQADVVLDREEAARLAREVWRRAKAGEDFDALAREPRGGHYRHSPLPRVLDVVGEGVKSAGATKRRDLPAALARVAFGLGVGEVGLVEYHEEESPFGWHVLLRIE